MITRRMVAVLVAWLPVAGLLMVTSAPPGSPQVRVTGHLRVGPHQYYGGEALVWRGDIGPDGRRRIHLQKRDGAGAAWADVLRSTRWTRRNGRFRFVHPAPQMNAVQYRVVAGRFATRAVTFHAQHQAVEVAVRPADPRVPVSRAGTPQLAVAGEPFAVVVDTAPRSARVLAGRRVTLHQRIGDVAWTGVDAGSAGRDGWWRATGRQVDAPGTVVYRARTADWTRGGDRVGWHLSFPTYVRVVERPRPVAYLSVAETGTYSARLVWQQPTDPAVEAVVVARVEGQGTPTVADAVGRLPAAATSYVDRSLAPERTYTWAVFTVREVVRDQGVFSGTAPTVEATTEAETSGGGGRR